jgi:hypothetical protein
VVFVDDVYLLGTNEFVGVLFEKLSCVRPIVEYMDGESADGSE